MGTAMQAGQQERIASLYQEDFSRAAEEAKKARRPASAPQLAGLRRPMYNTFDARTTYSRLCSQANRPQSATAACRSRAAATPAAGRQGDWAEDLRRRLSLPRPQSALALR
eukprot:TRINITY_DN27179_c0_g1_i1.p1 TRINITY_DN27179_c0_g1~~TRINITY_DN27179_c0_g1_i1.p1  ORF type:complete len:111 (-),score=15.83 TRINITY_DN27179_c0_g1_i1:78-410(-)